MSELLWRIVAAIVCTRPVTAALVWLAYRRPYWHIRSDNGLDVYMRRYWLFNPYKDSLNRDVPDYRPRWPSIRLHYILRGDADRHLHDHPWCARTIILRGGYVEERYQRDFYDREAGYTGPLQVGELHRIAHVEPGTLTLFITWGKSDAWGFMVNGEKIHHRAYAELKKAGKL